MTDKNRNLYYLHELSDYKVADDYTDVRGWKVEDADKRTIGKVDNLLVDKKEKRVIYLDVEVDESVIQDGYKTYEVPASEGVHGFLNKDGDNHIIIPIEMASLDEANRKVRTNEINFKTFTTTRRFSKGTDIDREFELFVLQSYLPDKKYNERD